MMIYYKQLFPEMIGGLGFSRSPICRALGHTRGLLTLAIETSCDDTSVALLEKIDGSTYPQPGSTPGAILHFHERITANNQVYQGIHPVIALDSHQTNLANLISRALRYLPIPIDQHRGRVGIRLSKDSDGISEKRVPDFITVTRGPGIRSSLSTGLDTAKGLAVAWQRPLVAINHMQAHALTPRLVAALENDVAEKVDPKFPFFSLLVSGGHTMLVHSKELVDHQILASTHDIAIGDMIDKCARLVLPAELLQSTENTMYGQLLEDFAFPSGLADYDYFAPATRAEELTRKTSSWGWAYGPPLAETRSGSKSKAMEYSFSGLESATKRFVRSAGPDIVDLERIDLAREVMRVAFEHLASRVVMGLNAIAHESDAAPIATLVVSGGVASNQFLKHVLRQYLDSRGWQKIRLIFPPPRLCTDNAAMIAWAGMEMFEAGWETDLSCKALRKWSVDPNALDGGILGANGWKCWGH